MRPRPTLAVFAAGLTAAPAAGLTAAPAAASPYADAAVHDALERAVVRRINAVRARHGLPRVTAQRMLARAASAHSAEQLRAGYTSHNGADGTPFTLRMRRYTHARSTGETIAWLAPSQRRKAAAVVHMWLRSPVHRRVLLERRFRRVGVGRRSGVLGGRVMTVVTANFTSAR
jgi:uncharacterized protein YkwD